jgi:hypothetical protein
VSSRGAGPAGVAGRDHLTCFPAPTLGAARDPTA